MAISISVQGIPATQAFLSMTSKAVLNKAGKAVLQAGFYVEGEVKKSIAGQKAEPKSVDTGRFLNSVETKKIGPLSAKIKSDVEYAQHLEYGTSKINPRHHFTNTANREKVKVQSFVQAAVKSATS